MHPILAPSLRELSSESETEGVSSDEWKTPFVGAMKIARNLPVSERYIEWYAPHPGSLSEGAAERSEAEGVYYDERKRSKISEFM